MHGYTTKFLVVCETYVSDLRDGVSDFGDPRAPLPLPDSPVSPRSTIARGHHYVLQCRQLQRQEEEEDELVIDIYL